MALNEVQWGWIMFMAIFISIMYIYIIHYHGSSPSSANIPCVSTRTIWNTISLHVWLNTISLFHESLNLKHQLAMVHPCLLGFTMAFRQEETRLNELLAKSKSLEEANRRWDWGINILDSMDWFKGKSKCWFYSDLMGFQGFYSPKWQNCDLMVIEHNVGPPNIMWTLVYKPQ